MNFVLSYPLFWRVRWRWISSMQIFSFRDEIATWTRAITTDNLWDGWWWELGCRYISMYQMLPLYNPDYMRWIFLSVFNLALSLCVLSILYYIIETETRRNWTKNYLLDNWIKNRSEWWICVVSSAIWHIDGESRRYF